MDLIHFSVFPSSLGSIILVSRNKKLIRLDVSKESELRISKTLSAAYPEAVKSVIPFKETWILLDRYLKGERVDFNTDVDISALNDFTRKVLLKTRQIPYGQVRSYLWVAKQIGYYNAARAVGQALKRNPIPLIIPCHRVIREDGSMGGFSLEGVSKEYLLSLEGTIKKIRRGREG